MKKIIYLLMFLTLWSCSEDSVSEMEQEVVDTVTLPEQNEGEGEVQTIDFRGLTLEVQEFNGVYLFEGDIIIPKSKNKSASISESYLWNTNTIPYTIDANLEGKYRVHNAISHWEEKTNIRFVERTTQSDYVYFTTGSGCSSYIGQIGGRQEVKLSSSCSTGNTIHEIGHAVGLWHEHTRADRDEYVKILWDNIRDGREHNFTKYTETSWGGIDLTSELDFTSIMMYGSYFFSSNGYPTITTLDGSTYSVQRYGLSKQDIEGINILYPDLSDTDWDKDGILNTEDECPNEAGESLNNGCPWVHGQEYTLFGVTVLRYNDNWYFKTIYGYKRVEMRPRGDSYAWYWL